MKKDIINNMTRSFSRTGLKLKKYSPEILVVTGVIGTVTSAVLACKATTKASAILEESKSQLEKVHEVAETRSDVYTPEDMKKDTTIIYTQTAVKFIKLYAPSVILSAVSITSILAGNNILRKRNVAIAAAYATVDKGFKEYRSRVVERFGKEVDHEIRHNIKAQTFEKTTVDKNGKEKIEKETVNVSVTDPNEYSDYARIFDESCIGWTKDPERNLQFLKIQQSYANDKLKQDGYLFLNDVYAMIGIPKTSAGQVVGWIYDKDCPNGDNFVDFGIYDLNRPKARDFVNGYERSIVIDPNIDGVIYDKL